MPNMGQVTKGNSRVITMKTQTFVHRTYRIFISLKYEEILFNFQIGHFLKSVNI